MGYTPLFDSLTRGTLYGRWPDIGLWPIVLALADRDGIVDAAPKVIAGIAGLPVDEVIECMDRFCQPDPMSRTKTEGGRRLALLDPARPWGWRVVNHAYYREKARLAAKNSREVSAGLNRQRMEDRRSPPKTADDPLSNGNENKTREEGERVGWGRRCPANFAPDLSFARLQLPDIDAETEAARFKDFEFKTPRKDWGAVWRNWIRTCKDTGKYARKDAIKWT